LKAGRSSAVVNVGRVVVAMTAVVGGELVETPVS